MHRVDKFKITTAEKKVFVTIIYYTLLQVGFVTIITYYGTKIPQLKNEMYSYFMCARDYNTDCEEPPLQDIYSPGGIIVSWILGVWIPILQLVYVINFEKTKKYICQKLRG